MPFLFIRLPFLVALSAEIAHESFSSSPNPNISRTLVLLIHPPVMKEKEKNNSVVFGVLCSCAEMKILLSSLLILCSIATLVQFLPSRFSPFSSDLRSCLSSFSSPSPSLPNTTTTTAAPSPSQAVTLKQEISLPSGVIKRAFNPIGSAAYLFIQMGAYRGGPNTFAVVGLGSKPLHVYSKPSFHCDWIPDGDKNRSFITTTGYKILPDWGYGRVYTVVVVNCTFPEDVGADGSGGRLILRATTGGGGDSELHAEERILALEEAPGSYNATTFTAPPEYDYLYCGSSLYGPLSPQRVREWMAYHARFFGGRAHFVFHDAGGVHPGVMEVLRPWIEMGLVTLQDIREQERFDGYYHNQFLVVNDCLHRYKHKAKWIFFFDVDEFLYVERGTTLKSLMDSLSGFTQFTIEQMPMSSKLCLSADAGETARMWGIEKLVYRDVKRGVRRDRKYAVQPRNAFAAGVHLSQNVAGKTLHKTERRIKYFHYHGTIAERHDSCREFVNATSLTFDATPFVLDDTLRGVASAVKRFELKNIGPQLRRTRQ